MDQVLNSFPFRSVLLTLLIRLEGFVIRTWSWFCSAGERRLSMLLVDQESKNRCFFSTGANHPSPSTVLAPSPGLALDHSRFGHYLLVGELGQIDFGYFIYLYFIYLTKE